MFVVALLAALASGAQPVPPAPGQVGPAERPDPAALTEAAADALRRYRRDVFYVVDAWVIRRNPDDPQYAVAWDRPPQVDVHSKVVSEEWVVVDGTSRLLTVAQFGVLSGTHSETPRRARRSLLGGIQRYHDRSTIEDLAAERQAWAAARSGLPPEVLDEVRDTVVASLPEPTWAPVPPERIE